jgi:hypothetical protein
VTFETEELVLDDHFEEKGKETLNEAIEKTRETTEINSTS